MLGLCVYLHTLLLFLFYCGLLFVFKNVIPCEYEIVMQLMHLIFIFSSNTSVGPHALMGMFVELLEFDGAVLNGLTNITNELKRALHWATVMLRALGSNLLEDTHARH